MDNDELDAGLDDSPFKKKKIRSFDDKGKNAPAKIKSPDDSTTNR